MEIRLSGHGAYRTEYEISPPYPESWLKKVYWKEDVVWSPGYFVSTVGIDEEKILKYVEWQSRQDSGQMKFEY